METAVKDKIASVMGKMNEVREIEEKHVPTQEEIDNFLDAINGIKGDLIKSTSSMLKVTEILEELSWFDRKQMSEPEKESLDTIFKDIGELHPLFIKRYLALTTLRLKGIAKDEIKAYKNAIDDLKEISEDVKYTLYNIGENDDFNSITSSLSLL